MCISSELIKFDPFLKNGIEFSVCLLFAKHLKLSKGQ